jgi:hypothetical protein
MVTPAAAPRAPTFDRPEAADLIAPLRDARARTLELVAGLEGDALMGPKLSPVGDRASRVVP